MGETFHLIPGRRTDVFDFVVAFRSRRFDGVQFIDGFEIWPPWGGHFMQEIIEGECFRDGDPDDPLEVYEITPIGQNVEGTFETYIDRFRISLAFADVAVSRRYGDRLYLSGKLEHIVTDDELCVLYSRPGSTILLNLKGDTSEYTYLKDTVGSFDLATPNKYLEFNYSGYYILEAWDVTDNCETRSQKRDSWILDVTQPKYQYQLYFDVDAPELGDKAYLLQAEWDKYNSWKPYGIIKTDPDCFSGMLGDNQPTPRASASGWLCQAAEPLGSGCWPLPWWMCRGLTKWDIYMRGECSCDDFRNTLGELGIPCHHLIAMYEEYGSEPPYCGYVKCP